MWNRKLVYWCNTGWAMVIPVVTARAVCYKNMRLGLYLHRFISTDYQKDFSARITKATMATTELVPTIEHGIEIYNTLKDDMKKALALKQYAEHLSFISQTLADVGQHLSEHEREIVRRLNEAYTLSQDGMKKATAVVTTIKDHCNGLLIVLSDYVHGSNEYKLRLACELFSVSAEKIEAQVREAQDVLRRASNLLYTSRNDLRSIIDTLQRLQNNFIEDQKAAIKRQRDKAYKTAAIGAAFGPIGLIISYAITGGVTEGMSIPNIEANFARQRETIAGYIPGLELMYSETDAMQENLDEQRRQLVDIRGKLSVAGELAGTDLSSEIHFNTVRLTAEALVQACDEALRDWR